LNTVTDGKNMMKKGGQRAAFFLLQAYTDAAACALQAV
jgi:hypothetical protein